MSEEQPPTVLKQWEFDHFSHEHWAEVKAGNVDKTKSWVELSEVDTGGLYGQKITVYTNREPVVEIVADRDQWGTWIEVSVGGQQVTIAQEDETKSFVDALIAALTAIKYVTDLGTTPPILTELVPDGKENDQDLD